MSEINGIIAEARTKEPFPIGSHGEESRQFRTLVTAFVVSNEEEENTHLRSQGTRSRDAWAC